MAGWRMKMKCSKESSCPMRIYFSRPRWNHGMENYLTLNQWATCLKKNNDRYPLRELEPRQPPVLELSNCLSERFSEFTTNPTSIASLFCLIRTGRGGWKGSTLNKSRRAKPANFLFRRMEGQESTGPNALNLRPAYTKVKFSCPVVWCDAIIRPETARPTITNQIAARVPYTLSNYLTRLSNSKQFPFENLVGAKG